MITVSKGFQDYDDDDPNLQFRKNRFDFWTALKKCHSDYKLEIKYPTIEDFKTYLIETYGMDLTLHDGHITDTYKIIDDQKFLIFKLKYF